MGLLGLMMLQAFVVVCVVLLVAHSTVLVVAQATLYRLGLWHGNHKKRNKDKDKETEKKVTKRFAVIGAGSSGITAAKCLTDDGHEVVVFERSDKIGGNWVFNPKVGHSSIYEGIVIDTSKDNSCFSDYPFPSDLPHFLPHHEIRAYLESYADHFQVRKLIRFNTAVVWVEPIEHDKEDGSSPSSTHHRWRVTSKPCKEEKEIEDAESDVEEFDAVAVCNGHHWSPRITKFLGEEEFEGEIFHSHYYKSPKPYEGKRVVVVGVGNSGCDIATECSKVCKQVYLSTRRGCFVIPKYYFGRPLDHVFTNRFYQSLPWIVKVLGLYLLTRILQGEPALYGLKSKHGLMQREHPTVNQEILTRIAAHAIRVKPNIKLIKKTSVVFEDDSEVTADVIVYATGYHIEFPFFDAKKLLGHDPKTNDNKLRLYHNVVPTSQKYPGIYFIGFIQPLGAIFPIAELQTRWVSRIESAKCSLPSPIEMEADVTKRVEAMAKHYVASARHTIQVDFVHYCDKLAELIGAKPKLWKHFDLLKELLFGCVTPVQYRLDGPNKWKGAAKALKDIYVSCSFDE